MLLGEAWKSNESFTLERQRWSISRNWSSSDCLQVLADEQKKLYPDCWKRKRSLSSAASNSSQTSSASSGDFDDDCDFKPAPGPGQSPGLSPTLSSTLHPVQVRIFIETRLDHHHHHHHDQECHQPRPDLVILSPFSRLSHQDSRPILLQVSR